MPARSESLFVGVYSKTRAVIVSVAHLDDDERALVLGVLVVTQNPMDLDYLGAEENPVLWWPTRVLLMDC